MLVFLVPPREVARFSCSRPLHILSLSQMHLSERLLMGNSQSEQAEKTMIAKLKVRKHTTTELSRLCFTIIS